MAAGVELRAEKLDVQDFADRKRAEDWDVDVLVNNAGIGESGPLCEVSVDLVRANFETNVFGALELTQRMLRAMLKKKGEKIVSISSIAGRITIPYSGPYCMTKHALEVVSEALSLAGTSQYKSGCQGLNNDAGTFVNDTVFTAMRLLLTSQCAEYEKKTNRR